MTVQELYDWAKENDCLSNEINIYVNELVCDIEHIELNEKTYDANYVSQVNDNVIIYTN